MIDDETGGNGGRSADGPDPSFIKRLEDDSLWPEEWGTRSDRQSGDESETRRERAARREGEPRRREARQGAPRRSAHYTPAELRRAERKGARRSRRMAVAVLLVAAVVILIAGLQVKDSEFGSSNGGASTPFSLVPLDTSRVTSTTEPATTSTSYPGLPESSRRAWRPRRR